MKTITLKAIASFILAAVVLSSVCCERHGKAWESMDLAEEVMNSKPDSALYLLNSIQAGSLDGKKEQARYALLMSMALDKNVIDTTTFDILHPAIAYYIKKGTADEKLRTYYYQGRIFQNRGENDSAMYSFLRGREFFPQAKDTMTIANLMVAQATIQYRMYNFDDYIRNNIDAARLYGELDRADYEVSCLANAMDGCVINSDKTQADSILHIVKVKIADNPFLNYLVRPYFLTYLLKFGDKEEVKTILELCSSQDSTEDLDKIDLATAYYKIGDHTTAKRVIDSIGINSNARNSLKYLSIKPNILEKNGDYPGALESYREFSATIDSIHMQMMAQDLLFAQKKHDMEKSNLIEIHKRDRSLWIMLFAALFLFISLMFIYYRYRLSQAENQKTELKRQTLLQANEKLELERKNTLLEKDAAESECARQSLETENLRMKIEQLEKESLRLREIIEERKDLEKPLRDILMTRMEMLNALLASEITKNDKYARHYNQWKDQLIKDKDEFMKSTRLALKALYPRFIEYLENHDLSESEINYLCLYALGLRGNEVGEYIQIKRHYHISSDIRKKLGIDEHETNIEIYVRKLMKSL